MNREASICAAYLIADNVCPDGSLKLGGVGSEGDVYLHEPDDLTRMVTAIKVSDDTHDAAAALWIKRHHLPHSALPIIHGLYQVFDCTDYVLFVTHREDLADLSPAARHALRGPLYRLEDELWHGSGLRDEGRDMYAHMERFHRIIRADVKLLRHHWPDTLGLYAQAIALHAWGLKWGMAFRDVHEDNYGMRGQQLVLRDLGHMRPIRNDSPEWWAWDKIQQAEALRAKGR